MRWKFKIQGGKNYEVKEENRSFIDSNNGIGNDRNSIC
jgi:hypothetical protein